MYETSYGFVGCGISGGTFKWTGSSSKEDTLACFFKILRYLADWTRCCRICKNNVILKAQNVFC